MPLDRTWYNTLVDDSGAGLDGTIWNKAALDALFNVIDNRVAEWVTVPFSAGNFSGNGAMTWTVDAGDVIVNKYCRVGNVLVWTVQLAATTIAGTLNTILLLAAPAGITFVSTGNFSLAVFPLASYTSPVSGVTLGVQQLNASNWPAGVNNTYVYFTWIGQVT